MTTRDRFLATLRDGAVGCPPRLEREIRDEVLAVWVEQGYPAGAPPEQHFGLDRWQNAGLYGTPRINLFADPPLEFTPTHPDQAATWREHFRRDGRIADDWAAQVATVEQRDWPLGLGVFRGLFLSFGVSDGDSLQEHLLFLCDYPDTVDAMLRHLTDLTVELVARALEDLVIDFIMFHEPICSHHGPVIGPHTFRRHLAPLYRELVGLGRAAGVELFIFETYGHATPLLPAVLETGCNGLWIAHAAAAGVDYPALRNEFGSDLALIGGVDDRALRDGPEAVRREIGERTKPLLAAGRYLPMLDDRVRENVPLATFELYDTLLREAIASVG